MIALYSRVSTSEQASEGYSIGEQQERLQKYCESRGWKGFKHFVDGGFSGGNTDRPALQEMIKGIHEGTVKKVIVYKLDRLSRSQKDTLELIEDVFIPNDVDFISITENLDTGSAFGRASIGLMACFAQLERENIKERITLGRNARAKKGKWHGGSCYPVGYTYNGDLIINDFEAMQVKECFKMYLSGHTFTEIADYLNSKGWTHSHGNWLPQRVRYILTNPLYIGMVSFSGSWYPGTHEPIIDKETFEAVGKLIEQRHVPHGYNRRSVKEAYLLGKIYCARCGSRYTHNITISGHKKDNPKISYYACTKRLRPKRHGKCDNKNHRCDNIDSIVFDSMMELDLADVIQYRSETDSPKLDKELEKVKKQRDRLIDLYTMGTFSPEELQDKAYQLEQKRKAIESQMSHRSLDDMNTILKSIGDVIDHGDPVQIRALVEDLIDRVEIDGDDITIYWDFE